MRETDILKKIRANWTSIHLVAIESATANGIPDVNFCHNGQEVWLELKLLRGDRIYCELFQAQFHISRNRKGGTSLVFAASPEEIRIIRIHKVTAVSFARVVGKFRVFDSTDPFQCDTILTWRRPFKWPEMFNELMEKIKCLQNS